MKTKTSSKLDTVSNITRSRGRPHLFYPDIVEGVSALIVDMHGKAHTAEEIALAITNKFVDKAGNPLKVCSATVRTFGRKSLNLLWHVGKRRADGTLNAYGSDIALPAAAAKVPATKGRTSAKSAKSTPKSAPKGRSKAPAKGGGKAKGRPPKPASAPRNASQSEPKAKGRKVRAKDSAVSA